MRPPISEVRCRPRQGPAWNF